MSRLEQIAKPPRAWQSKKRVINQTVAVYILEGHEPEQVTNILLEPDRQGLLTPDYHAANRKQWGSSSSTDPLLCGVLVKLTSSASHSLCSRDVALASNNRIIHQIQIYKSVYSLLMTFMVRKQTRIKTYSKARQSKLSISDTLPRANH